MSQLRRNPLTGRWVVVAPDRSSRPMDYPARLTAHTERTTCPFCPGHEGDTLPALETYGRDDVWLVRVFPNLFPAFAGAGGLEVEHLGAVFDQAPSTGLHEVVVFTPDHESTWGTLDDEQAALVIAALRDRLEDHSTRPAIAYSQAIVNRGREAGASLEHPHAQLLSVPFVPDEIDLEAQAFADAGGCLLCRVVAEEEPEGHRTVLSNDSVLVVCPFWSGSPYEMLVLPTRHEAHLSEARPSDLVAVSLAVRDALARLGAVLGEVAYNVIFHTAPHRHQGTFHWHAHLVPRLASIAGFEIATGILINPVPPERAAPELSGATLP